MGTTDPLEGHTEARSQIQKSFDEICPHVRGNPFIPHWPLPTQAVFLGLHQTQGANDEVFQALYGGAAGGGKSDALLMAAAQYAWKFPDFAGICFRRTFSDLTQPGALLDRAMDWWLPAGAHWAGSRSMFVFPSGAKISFAFLRAPHDHLKYQGAEYHYSAWDELTQWPDSKPYEYVGISRLRRLADCEIPLRTLAASNPGGPGHNWVQREFIGGTDAETGHFSHARHLYVPARIQDNPYLDQKAYIKGLMHMHPTVREQLLNGDWSARESGDYFRRDWFGGFLQPEELLGSRDCIRVRWWDLAASEKTTAARTAGVLMSRGRTGVRAIEHATAFRKTPGARDDAIVTQAKLDGHEVYVGIEIEGGSGGIAQFEALEKRLRAEGFKAVGARPSTMTDKEKKTVTRAASSESAKAARADPVASCLERGSQRRGECEDTGGPWWGEDRERAYQDQRDGIRIFVGPWLQGYLDEVEGFPEVPLKDFADATTGAWSWLEAHPFGVRIPPMGSDSTGTILSTMDVHPEDRPVSQSGKDRKGLWRP